MALQAVVGLEGFALVTRLYPESLRSFFFPLSDIHMFQGYSKRWAYFLMQFID